MTEGKRTPELIGAEIRMYVEAQRKICLLYGIEIGRRLTEAKEMLQHGEWLPWLERETEFSSSSAQRYMKLFKEYGDRALAPELLTMPVSIAAELINVPENEREALAKEIDEKRASFREVKQRISQRYATEDKNNQDQQTQESMFLKKCPFCDGDACFDGAVVNDKYRGMIFLEKVKCKICKASSNLYPDRETAAQAWNRRHQG